MISRCGTAVKAVPVAPPAEIDDSAPAISENLVFGAATEISAIRRPLRVLTRRVAFRGRFCHKPRLIEPPGVNGLPWRFVVLNEPIRA